MSKVLEDIEKLPASQRLDPYLDLLTTYLRSKDMRGLLQLIGHVVRVDGDELPTSTRPQLVAPFVRTTVQRLLQADGYRADHLDLDDCETVGRTMVELLQRRGADSFPEALYYAVDFLATVLEAHEKFEEAVQTRTGSFDMARQAVRFPDLFTPHARVRWNMHIASCLLQASNTAAVTPAISLSGSGENQYASDALRTLQKVANLVNQIEDEALKVPYQFMYAESLERCGRTTEAANRYMELAFQPPSSALSESRRNIALQNAALLALLSPASPSRSRVLSHLLNDKRFDASPLHDYTMRVVFERMIPRASLDVLLFMLPERMSCSSGPTNSKQVMLRWREHNLMAASRIYKNISLKSLAELLECNEEEAEELAVRLILNNQLAASVDQENGCVVFNQAQSELALWREQVAHVCQALTDLSDTIASSYPALGVDGVTPDQE